MNKENLQQKKYKTETFVVTVYEWEDDFFEDEDPLTIEVVIDVDTIDEYVDMDSLIQEYIEDKYGHTPIDFIF